MIAIKDMEMPSCCNECPMYQSEDSDYCDITGEWITGEEMIRHPNCPLVEIVTCKDCKHWHDDGIMTTCDKNIGHGFPKDHFCGDGKRRE